MENKKNWKEISFRVQGGSPPTSEVTFFKGETFFNAHCTCVAGRRGYFCRHRVDILDGKLDSLISNNADEVAIVVSWLAGTRLENVLKAFHTSAKKLSDAKQALDEASGSQSAPEYQSTLATYEEAKQEFSSTKKKLSTIMHQ